MRAPPSEHVAPPCPHDYIGPFNIEYCEVGTWNSIDVIDDYMILIDKNFGEKETPVD